VTPTELALVIGRMQAVEAPWPVAGVSLTDPSIADVEILTEVLLMVTGRGPGATDLLLWNDQGQTHTLPIEVQIDSAGLQADLKLLFPDSSLAIGQSRGVAVISGVLARAEQATQLGQFMEATGLAYVDATRVAGVQQVQVQVRMAEVSRTGLRALGVNAFSTSDNWFGGVSVGSSNGGALNPVQIGPGEGTPIDPLSVQFNEDVLLSPAVTLFAGSTNAGFQVFVQALQENQYLRILAEPNLVALSGETASFLAGGEFPIPVVQGTTTGGGTAVTIEYKEFGVALKFRPVVLGDASIRMTVASEVSELSDIGAVELEGFRVPSVATRRAETTLEMKSGQSFAMAGLISESTSAISSQVPGLGSLPVLGALFRSVRYRRGESELLLLVTASLVEPTSDQVLLPLPGTTHVVPNDWELYSRGRLEGEAPARLSPDDRTWLAECGLERLRGPGAWSVHGQAPARAYYQRRESAERRYDRTLDPEPSPSPELPPAGEVN
jgi:pilus assembly protein CpaC